MPMTLMVSLMRGRQQRVEEMESEVKTLHYDSNKDFLS